MVYGPAFTLAWALADPINERPRQELRGLLALS
jgi:hypothetical protein